MNKVWLAISISPLQGCNLWGRIYPGSCLGLLYFVLSGLFFQLLIALGAGALIRFQEVDFFEGLAAGIAYSSVAGWVGLAVGAKLVFPICALSLFELGVIGDGLGDHIGADGKDDDHDAGDEQIDDVKRALGFEHHLSLENRRDIRVDGNPGSRPCHNCRRRRRIFHGCWEGKGVHRGGT